MTDLRKKIVAVATVFTVLLGMAGPAMAATAEELQASIDALMAELADLKAELAELTGEVVTECCTFTRNLYPDIVGADVKCLQEYLNAAGYELADSGAGSPGNETTYFGSLTRAAVKEWQDANDVEYGVWWGYFGPISQAKYDEVCVAEEEEEEEEEEEAVLEGGAGSITDADFISSLNNEEVGESAADVKVAGLELEADEGSDIQLTAVRLVFVKTSTGAGSSDDFEDYAEDVSLLFDGEEVARVDGDEFDDDNDYSRTVTLDSGAVIRADETEELVVAVSGIGNLDSSDAGEEWTVEFNSIRFRDAQGAVITDAATGDIGTATRGFSFETYATAADTELNISAGDDEVNDAHVINVDDADDTDDVEVLSFTIEIEGDSDIELKELPVQFDTVTGGTGHIENMVPSVQLLMDDDEIGSENLDGADGDDTETVPFEDLDVVLEAGETYDFLVTANFNELDGIILVAGDTFAANIGTVERDLIEAEDESGEDLATGDMTGTVTGDPHAIYDAAISVELVSVSKEKTFAGDDAGEDDQGTYDIVFDVTAFDGDMRIDKSTEDDNDTDAAGQGVVYDITSSAGTPTVSSAVFESSSTDSEDNTNVFEVDEDTTRRFTLEVVLTGDNGTGSHEVVLESINWGTATDNTNANYYTFNLGEFKTGSLFLTDR